MKIMRSSYWWKYVAGRKWADWKYERELDKQDKTD